MKTVKRLLFVLFSVLMIVSVCLVPGLAANTTANGSGVEFKEYLIVQNMAHVPHVGFHYTLEGMSANGDECLIPAKTVKGKSFPAVYATADTASVKGEPTVENDVEFLPTDETYSEIQEGDNLVLATGEKYAKHTVNLDFSGVSFKKPGIYRFRLTREATGALDGLVDDETPERFVDVYVEQNAASTSNDLVVTQYVIHKAEDEIPANGEDWSITMKDSGFTPRHETYNLTIEKYTTGNHGSKLHDFTFTVTLKNAIPGTRYYVMFDKEDSNGAKESYKNLNKEISAGDKTMYYAEADKSGNAVITLFLSDSDSAIVCGITPGTVCNVSENREDYEPSWKILETGAEGKTAKTEDFNMGKSNKTVVFTNKRTVTPITGVVLNVWPFVAAIIFAGSALFVTRLKKKREHSVTE